MRGRGSPRARPHRQAQWLLALLMLLPVTIMADPSSPLAWLDRMNQSLRELDYEGYLVQQHDYELDTSFLVHRASGQHEFERLVSMTGNAREVIRGEEAVACLEPGQSEVQIRRIDSGRGYLPLMRAAGTNLQASYEFSLGGTDRVAGRTTRIIEIKPKDRYRYGYQLYLDNETALPLRSLVYDEHGSPVSQTLFVNIKTGDFVTAIEKNQAAMALVQHSDASAKRRKLPMTMPMWQFDELPPGFVMVTQRRQLMENGDQAREHFIFSDGLAGISVHVEPATADGLDGYANARAVQFLGRRVADHQVTAVGKAPRETLKALLDTMRPTQR